MIVVPTFAESDQGQEQVVSTVVGGGVTATPEKVAEGVNCKCRVERQHRADGYPPDQAAPAPDQEAHACEHDSGEPVVAVEPAELRIPPPVTDRLPVRFVVVPGENPPEVGPPETAGARRMQILGSIRMQVVMSVVPHPPERPLLQGTAAKASQHELKGSTRLVRAMGKIAVVACRDAEHMHQVTDR